MFFPPDPHGQLLHIEMSPDGSRFVTIQKYNTSIWSIGGQLIAPLAGTDHRPYSIGISRDGSQCATGFEDGIVKIWDMSDGALRETLKIDSDETIVEISPDLSKVCTQPKFKSVQIWNLRERTLLRTIETAGIVKINSDETKIAISSGHGDFSIWDIANGELIKKIDHTYELPLIIDTMTPDDYIGLNLGQDSYVDECEGGKDEKKRQSVKIWDSNTCSWLATLFDEEMKYKDCVSSIAIGPQAKQAVTGHCDGTFKIWTIIPSNLLDALSTISLEQLWLLEGIFEQAIKGKKADLSHINKPEIVNYIEQYGLLPNLIKVLVKDDVKFE